MIFFKKRIKLGDCYACNQGDHVGKFLIYVDKNKSQYAFITTPNMETLWVPIDKFDLGKKSGIIEYVERVPKSVRETAKAKFEDNKSQF